MSGRIAKGDLVVVVPPPREPRKDDVVLCRVRAQYCHLVTAVRNGRYQISNNHGHVNGWIGRGGIFGIAEPVRP
jgi:hypothetical protein